MKDETRFTLLPFPQFYDGGTQLTLRLVLMPRNQNPLQPAIEQHAVIPDPVPAFADAALTFEASIISGLNNFPYDELTHDTKPLPTAAPANARDLFVALGEHFKITNRDRSNQYLEAGVAATATKPAELTIRKYLPLSYRQAFNFTTPRTRNAVTDDSYRCAVRDAGLVPGFKRSPDEITWGKVFAYALRQKLLAEQLGMVYETTLIINETHFPQGGWLYIDLAADSDYLTQQQAGKYFIKRYAARIPALEAGKPRQLFAPILFPVLFKEKPADPVPLTDGNYDELFLEAAAYDDGFAKIVHARQPRSRDLLKEDSDGAHPVKDVGFRLGWDDEQILIWYMRQMTADPTVVKDASKRLDAILGVFGYSVDAREVVAGPENPWNSLNAVTNKVELTVPAEPQPIALGDFKGDLPFQVYPAQLDGDKNKSFWLPMYFANWNGHSMVLPDNDAARIYQTTGNVKADPHTGVSGKPDNKLNDLYEPAPIDAELGYGGLYEFRVRLRDLSGGGSEIDKDPIHKTPSNTVQRRFRRYIAPNQPRIEDLAADTDGVSEINEIKVRRPLLGYPAAVYTRKYANAVPKLIAASQAAVAAGTGHAFGISDPDVDRLEITVEIQSLKMDNLLSVSGKENYVHLYTTHCSFPPINAEADFDAVLNIPIVYRDCNVLHTGDELDLASDLGLPADVSNLQEIVVPTARTVRLTIRAVCEDKANNANYYGLLNNADHEQDVRYGHVIQMMMYKPSDKEKDLFLDVVGVPRLQGIFLQPDPPQVFDGTAVGLLLGTEIAKPPDMIQRLAKELGLENNGLTLMGAKGERVQFGCSNRIRHVLSPENSSLTFASKGDLMNHWLCCFSVQIDRDWTWDALEDRAFIIKREKYFTHDDPDTETESAEVGDIEIRHTAPFECLSDSKRNYTRLVFIDAVEPKNQRLQPAPVPAPPGPIPDKPRFPDTLEVKYTIETKFKVNFATERDGNEEQKVRLPITTPPSQVPRIVSAGLALSPYQRNAKYSASEPRRRSLWIEFAEPIDDPNDTCFARMLIYSPDQLISNNHPELFVATQDPSLPIDPEYITAVTKDSTNDQAGLRAMQPMEKATDSDRHYLLPLPPGVHSNADEMFGFFTYEFRVGHYRDASTPEKDDMVWSTAQGRYGRPLRVTGLQHPAPTLTCMVDRDEEKLTVAAPYAVAVFKGKNVTAEPPRTQLCCLLYAQVKQADNLDYRNILLDDKQLDWRVQIERDRDVNWFLKYDDQQRILLKNLNVKNWKDELDYAKLPHLFKLAEVEEVNKSATKYGATAWSNSEVAQLLDFYGLPGDSPLSVLVVEFLPTITNFNDHISESGQREMREFMARVHEEILRGQGNVFRMPARETFIQPAPARIDPAREQGPSPASDALGQRRILRTSPLTEVPFVCCTNCD